MKYYIIAGEASGDLHASLLMKELKKLHPSAEFRCWGGDLMAAEGGILVRHYRDLAFMGFLEVAMNFRTIMSNLKHCREDLIAYHPDALILVDYPGFNLRVAGFAHEQGLRVFYYISPQVWAWKKSRVHRIRKTVDRMFVILPFEKEFYAKYGYDVEFVGHPLVDVVTEALAKTGKGEISSGSKPVIALLPGSRRQEIRRMLPVMAATTGSFNGYEFVIAGAPGIDEGFYHGIEGAGDLRIVFGRTYELLMASKAALVTSGTATLETALFGVPQVVCYKGSPASYFIARRLVNVPFISLVNLITGREVVKELIQDKLSPENLRRELAIILEDDGRKSILEDYGLLRERLGDAGAAGRAAAGIFENLRH